MADAVFENFRVHVSARENRQHARSTRWERRSISAAKVAAASMNVAAH
jgi:hypothetical protein